MSKPEDKSMDDSAKDGISSRISDNGITLINPYGPAGLTASNDEVGANDAIDNGTGELDDDFFGDEANIDEGEFKLRSEFDRKNRELFKELNDARDESSFLEALAEIYNLNQGLVLKAVGQAKTGRCFSRDEDLMFEGNVGLLEAIVSYEYEKASFSTWAKPKIWSKVISAVKNDPRKVRQDSGIGEDLLFLLDNYKRLRGGEPDDDTLLKFAEEYRIFKRSGAPWDEEGIRLARKDLAQTRAAKSIEATEDQDEDMSEFQASSGEDGADDTGAFQNSPITGDEYADDGCESDRLRRIERAIKKAQLNPFTEMLMIAYIENLAAACKSYDEKRVFYADERVSAFTNSWADNMLLEGFRSESLRNALIEEGFLI